jgi:hypothetical protein
MKFFLSILLLSAISSTFAQSASQYDNIPLANAADYRKAEPQVILASDYVYSTAIDKDNQHRKNAILFIVKWMSGTPDFSFVMDGAINKITYNDNEVLGVYFACTTKYALQKGKGVDREDLKYNSFLLLATYCENPANNYKPKGEVKKLIEAKNQGKLQEYLDSKKSK